jgi:hypothetical protein
MANTTSTLNAALVAALGELRNVPKDKVNPHFKSRFTSLDAILDATRPVLAKHGLAMSQEPVFEDGMAGVVTRIIHAGGESRESKLLLPLRDQSAQGVGSCLSYARRYSAAAVLGIASDEDDDGQVASTPSKKPITQSVIAKPAFQPRKTDADKLADEITAPEPAKTAVMDQWQVMFGAMEANKISEAVLGSFLHSKGIDVPDFLADLPLPVVKRINEKFDDIVKFSKKFTA